MSEVPPTDPSSVVAMELETKTKEVDDESARNVPIAGVTYLIDGGKADKLQSDNEVISWGDAVPDVIHFLRCSKCRMIPPSQSKHFVCLCGHITCKKCAKSSPYCLYDWYSDGSVCQKPIGKVRPPILFKLIVEHLEQKTGEEKQLDDESAKIAADVVNVK